MQTLSTSPTRDRLAHLEQIYPKPSISSRETPLMFAQAVIAKEAAALDKLASTLDTSFVSAMQLILHSGGRVIFVGVGKSGLVGRKLAASFASLGTPAFFVHAVEAAHGDLGMITSRDVVLIISWGKSTLQKKAAYRRKCVFGYVLYSPRAQSMTEQTTYEGEGGDAKNDPFLNGYGAGMSGA
jgi:DNA-binding MurR/RpiR family transcriptional regulator